MFLVWCVYIHVCLILIPHVDDDPNIHKSIAAGLLDLAVLLSSVVDYVDKKLVISHQASLDHCVTFHHPFRVK